MMLLLRWELFGKIDVVVFWALLGSINVVVLEVVGEY